MNSGSGYKTNKALSEFSVMTRRQNLGLSLFELMLAIGIVGMLAGFAVPAYRSYIETANMTRVTANFEQSVRLGRDTFALHKTRMALGLIGTVPSTTDGWIEMFNTSGALAPGGGPAYIASTNNQTSGRGDPVTGAIGVDWREGRAERIRRNGSVRPAREDRLRLWRPLYLSLVEQRATITHSDIEVIVQRKN